jgi:hypothetical protein
MQEADAGRIMVRGQSGQKVFVRFQLKGKKLGVVAVPVIPTTVGNLK